MNSHRNQLSGSFGTRAYAIGKGVVNSGIGTLRHELSVFGSLNVEIRPVISCRELELRETV